MFNLTRDALVFGILFVGAWFIIAYTAIALDEVIGESLRGWLRG